MGGQLHFAKKGPKVVIQREMKKKKKKIEHTIAADSARRMSCLEPRAFMPTSTNSSQMQSMRYTDESTFGCIESAGTVVSYRGHQSRKYARTGFLLT
jgi:hypothetical protein